MSSSQPSPIESPDPATSNPVTVDASSKGLASGKVGVFSGAILGISTVAPGYTLTASIGLIVAAVGLKMPAIFIAGFIPMFLTAYAYRELNSDTPDCGASFTWSTKAFGPYVGWMWGGAWSWPPSSSCRISPRSGCNSSI